MTTAIAPYFTPIDIDTLSTLVRGGIADTLEYLADCMRECGRISRQDRCPRCTRRSRAYARLRGIVVGAPVREDWRS